MPAPTELTRTYRTAAALIASGVSCLPIKSDGSKSPALSEWKSLQARYATDEELTKWFSNGTGLAVIAGHISGNLEILDFDENGLYEEWKQAVIDHGLGEVLKSLVVVQTPSGGHHVYLRAEKPVGGNTKLAQTAARKTRIETRGEGGYALAPPSDGYKLVQGNPLIVPVVDAETRAAFHALAHSFNEFLEPERQVDGPRPKAADRDRNRPGDAYNDSGLSLELMERHGWKVVGRQGTKHLLRRPGKDGRGISATSNYANTGYLYVFSTNAPPFDACRAYSPFAVYALLEQGGDFGAAASVLGKQGFGEPARKPDSKATESDPESDGDEDKDDTSEYGLALTWAQEVEEQFCYVEGDQWWEYEKGLWSYSSLEKAQRSLQEFLVRLRESGHKITVTSSKVAAVCKTARLILGPHDVSEFNAHPTWIPLRNGVFDTATEVLMPHDPLHKLTYQAPYEYDARADCPTWKRCLQEWLITEDGTPCPEWIDLIQEWYGYCLIPDVTAQASMFWVGEGGNGKGVATRVLENLVGKEYTTAVPIEQLHDPYHRADLHGKLVGFVNEPDPKAMAKNANPFKAIVGGDPISARRPTEKVFTFVPTCRIVVSCNNLPSTKDVSRGYFRRILLIEWRYNVPEEKEDTQLDQKLRLEMPGIFNWALAGLRRWRERNGGFSVPAESRRLLEGYRLGEDTFLRFVQEECEQGQSCWISNADFYKAYSAWCQQFGERPTTSAMIGKRMPKMSIKSKARRLEGKLQRGWEGVELKTEDTVSTDEEGWTPV